MKAIILSAGQGRRLLPFTESRPKCLLPVLGERTILDLQLRALAENGVHEIAVMVGFAADQVEEHLAENMIEGLQVYTSYNPFYAESDNLMTCWLARSEMNRDFVLLNGDSLFEPAVLARLLASPEADLTLAVNKKQSYDSDDMKVILDGQNRLRSVGKTLPVDEVDAESIGVMAWRGRGTGAFRRALESAVRERKAQRAWYLSVVNDMARNMPIETADVSDLWWGEVDSPEDLTEVRLALEKREGKRPAPSHAATRAMRPGG